jgi:peptidoglycan hydrolase CwlO-like protein
VEQQRDAIEKASRELSEKEKENMRLQMPIEDLKTDISKKEEELMNGEEVLES